MEAVGFEEEKELDILELLRDLDTKDINKISGIFADKIYKI